MKLLIISKNKFDNIINNIIQPTDYDLVLNLSDNYFTYLDYTFTFSNLIDLLQKLESSDITISEITLIGGILDYSSEINIRTLFSGFINISKKSFIYFDKEKTIEERISNLNRSFCSLSQNPVVEKVDNNNLKINFSNKNNWSLYSDKKIEKLTQQKSLSSEELTDYLVTSINKKEPLSLIRLNHCENRLIGYDFTFDINEANITYDIQFGENLSEYDTSFISMEIKNAVKDSTILGVPTAKKNSTNKLHILENTTITHLNKLSLLNKQLFTNVNCHYQLGKSTKIKKALIDCESLVVITCRDIHNLEKSLNRKITKISIPEENRFSDKELVMRHFPTRFFEIENIIKNTIGKGTVVLVGAGILGKIYCSMVKKSGGIAIDVGSLMDAIANVDTRGNGFNNQAFWWNKI